MPSSRRLPFFPLPQPLSHFSGSIVASLCGSPFARATFYSFGEDDFITFALKKMTAFCAAASFSAIIFRHQSVRVLDEHRLHIRLRACVHCSDG